MPLLNAADAVYLGSSQVDRIYLGSDLVWPGLPYLVEDFEGATPLDRYNITGTSGTVSITTQAGRSNYLRIAKPSGGTTTMVLAKPAFMPPVLKKRGFTIEFDLVAIPLAEGGLWIGDESNGYGFALGQISQGIVIAENGVKSTLAGSTASFNVSDAVAKVTVGAAQVRLQAGARGQPPVIDLSSPNTDLASFASFGVYLVNSEKTATNLAVDNFTVTELGV